MLRDRLNEALKASMKEKKPVAVSTLRLILTAVKDMGKAMGLLRERHAGQMDFGKASAMLKAALSA